MWGTFKARSSGEQNGVYFENGKSVCVANDCQRLCLALEHMLPRVRNGGSGYRQRVQKDGKGAQGKLVIFSRRHRLHSG